MNPEASQPIHLHSAPQPEHPETSRWPGLVLVLAVVLFVLFWASILLIVPYRQFHFTPAWIFLHIQTRFRDFCQYAFGRGNESFGITIYQYAAAVVAGAALAACGAIFQGSFRNQLAGPSTMGVMSGGTLGCLIYLLCFTSTEVSQSYPDKFVPAEYGKSLWLALRLLVSRLLRTPPWDQRQQAIDALGSVLYYGALAQLKTTAMALVSGAALSISGAIFQTAYRNPMASPNILGATAGVSLGNVLVVLVYSTAAYDHILLRYGYCYGFTALCVALVLLLGYLAGDRRGSCGVLEMVIAGAIVSQALNVVTSYIMYNLEDQDLLLYEEIKLGTYLDTSLSSMLIFFGTMVLALLPVLLTRYRLNVLGLNGTESAALGLRCGPYRLMAQLCGVLMVTCAMIHCGEAGMLAMVIPYLVRQTVGASFHRVCVYSALAGGVLMMLCRLASSFLLIAEAPLPVSFLINLCLVPVFLVILVKQGRQTDAA